MAKHEITKEWLEDEMEIQFMRFYKDLPLVGIFKKQRNGEWKPLTAQLEKSSSGKSSFYIYFRKNGKRYKFPLGRIAYALHYGKCPKDMDVIFLNGRIDDVSKTNLVLKTHRENLYDKIWSKMEERN